jgi:hypothetical protein
LTPSTIAVRKCPNCGDIFGTDNYDGFFHMDLGMPWTDGSESDNIQLAEDLYKCDVCLKSFYIEQAEIVGLDRLDVEVRNGLTSGNVPVENKFWYINAPGLIDYKGSTLKHNYTSSYDYYLPLKGLPPDYKGISCYDHSTPDYNKVLENKIFTTQKQELELRLRQWWAEKYRYSDEIMKVASKPLEKCFPADNQILRGFALSETATDNLIRLIELSDKVEEYNTDCLPIQIMRSDMRRQLGRFEDCLNLLKRATNIDMSTRTDDGYNEIINLIIQSCNKNIRCARKIKLASSW